MAENRSDQGYEKDGRTALPVIEILSPTQTTEALIEKSEIYLNAGIQSV
ncbi:MAG: hypothetical protein GY749_08135 [Desulfobacteraceae bacterium]|nr:hypothetical protein [Desulfobacteraceae bacterium]MCP4347966.1 hypothetical protein [Desulfobacterales bacterium]